MAAYADGVMHAAERRLLLHVNSQLGFPAVEFDHVAAMVRSGRQFEQGPRARAQVARVSVADAYAVLNVSPEVSDDQIKKAY